MSREVGGVALMSLCIETGLALEIKNPSKTAGCVCFVTHSPIITKPLVLGMTLQWGVKYTLMEGVRGAQLGPKCGPGPSVRFA